MFHMGGLKPPMSDRHGQYADGDAEGAEGGNLAL